MAKAKTLYTHQTQNNVKTWFLMTMFFVVVIALGFGASYYFGNSLILYIAVAIAIGMNIFSYWYSDKVVLKMQGAEKLDPKKYPEVQNIMENLTITTGMPMPALYIMHDQAPNAFATGRNAEHSAVAVTTGLLEVLDRTELEGVLAHELSHIGNKDTLIQTVVVVLVGFVAILSDFFIQFSIFGGGDNDRDPRLAIIFTVVGILLAILAPIIATMIQLAISRKREFMADASGALLTRHPEGLASALQKISDAAKPMKKANTATAHLFISNPFGKKGGGFRAKMARYFMTHPPTEERVAALRDTGA